MARVDLDVFCGSLECFEEALYPHDKHSEKRVRLTDVHIETLIKGVADGANWSVILEHAPAVDLMVATLDRNPRAVAQALYKEGLCKEMLGCMTMQELIEEINERGHAVQVSPALY